MSFTKKAILAAVSSTALSVGAFAGTAWASVPTTGPAAGPSPGHGQNYVGSRHGVFGDSFGSLLSTGGSGFSSLAPSGDTVGQSNAVGSCPFRGIFPPQLFHHVRSQV